ncbi:methyl-accepting chemotaxis protein [Thalassobaculum salexigens]|uniref:methyl-accepting chemotaxis protein n=1 Tax=Thalassobaculum salexigens TaxID=455360 RepID=UPI00248F464F|nr:methyl-accepting chemotaxis protein [Thalassobaculum salexigens]
MSKLAFKIPALVLVAALVAGVGSSIVGMVLSSSAQEEAIDYRLVTVASERARSLQHYLETIQVDLETLSTSPVAFEAIVEFKRGWTEFFAKGPTKALQAAYITDNPNPTGSKEELDRADGPEGYHETHAHFHPWYRSFLRAKGFYDIFLFDTNGNLVYTVFKELDYATNFVNGEYADTGLGRVYQKAMANPGTVIFDDFEPYAPSFGAPASFIAKTVTDNFGNILGVLAFQMPIDRLNEVMQHPVGLGETGDTVILGRDKLRRSDSRFATDSALLKETISWPGADAVLAGEVGTMEGQIGDTGVLVGYAPVEFVGTTWGVMAALSADEAFASEEELLFYEALIGGLVLLVVLVAGILFSRTITSPLARIIGVMSTVSGGSYGVEVPEKGRGDEIGDIARALEQFRLNGQEAERLRVEQEEMRERNEAERIEALRAMARTVEAESTRAVENVSAETNAMTNQAEDMARSARKVEENSQTVAAAAQEALANAESVSAATEELAASIEEIASRVVDGATTAREAMAVGRDSQATIQTLADAAKQIGTVVVLIDDIAQQTGLLALNATIEAARAGDAGKGFAVVASEVKNLASQTAKATGEITEQIHEIQAITQRSVDAMRSMVERIGAIDEISTSVATAVEEQQAATQEIARNVSETASAAREVATNIELVSAEARSNLDVASAVQTASVHVKDAIESLKQAVVRVVRTSTPEVDRREQARAVTREAATLQLGSQRYDVMVLNTSEGGVGVELAEGVALSGDMSRGELSSASTGTRSVLVTGVNGRNVGLRFA